MAKRSTRHDASGPSKRCADTFAEFWGEYLARHQHPLNRWMHVIATLTSATCYALAVTFLSWKFLIAAPVVSYAIAWTGHLLEQNIPATFKNPLWAIRADYVMVWKMLTGQTLDASRAATSSPNPSENSQNLNSARKKAA